MIAVLTVVDVMPTVAFVEFCDNGSIVEVLITTDCFPAGLSSVFGTVFFLPSPEKLDDHHKLYD